MTTSRGLTGWHVLSIALGTLGIVVLVNVFFVFAALRSHSGVDEGDAYTLGLAYNDHIAERERQAAMGWTANVSSRSLGDRATELVIQLTGPDGEVLTGLAVEGELRRVVESRSDQLIVLTEGPPGRYSGTVALSFPGRWEGRFRATDEGGRKFDFEDVLWVE